MRIAFILFELLLSPFVNLPTGWVATMASAIRENYPGPTKGKSERFNIGLRW
jgi:hypothetical protein